MNSLPTAANNLGSPKIPPPPPVPPPPPLPPQLDSKQVSASGQAYEAQQARARGFGATILTSGSGAPDSQSNNRGKQLTGE